MEAKQVTGVKQNGTVVKKYFDYETGGLLFINVKTRTKSEKMHFYPWDHSEKFIIENWSFDFLSVLISFKLQLYSVKLIT